MEVPYAKNEQHFDTFIKLNRYLVAYFTAAWCGPCEAIRPVIDEIYNNAHYKKIQIVKIDIDSNQKLAKRLDIHSVPTFIFYEEGVESHRIRGVSNEIKFKIDELNAKATTDPESKERANSDANPALDPANYEELKDLIPKGFEVLNSTIHTGETIVLNVMPHKEGGNVKDVFDMKAKDGGIYSDADSQALFFIPLNNISKVYSILIKTIEPKDVKTSDLAELVLNEECQKPNSVKIWSNKPSILSFEDTSALEAPHMQSLDTSGDSEWLEIKLKYVRFQNVQNLNILIDGEDEDFHTLIEKIVIVGVSGENKEQGSIHQGED